MWLGKDSWRNRAQLGYEFAYGYPRCAYSGDERYLCCEIGVSLMEEEKLQNGYTPAVEPTGVTKFKLSNLRLHKVCIDLNDVICRDVL